MRKRFNQQIDLGVVPINEVEINMKTRHQLAPVLLALQYLFEDEQASEEVFKLLEKKVLKGKKRTGRIGMSLWEILVLGTVRFCLDVDFDFLHDMANNHEELRGILGVAKSDFTSGKSYHYQTIKDNVQLLDESTIKLMSEIAIKCAHELIKKEEGVDCLELSIKSDSYVVESDIHFPTDINLLWDSGRKCLDMIELLRSEGIELSGWNQHRNRRFKFRKVYRKASETHRKKGANYKERLEEVTKEYLEISGELEKKLKQTLIEGGLYVELGMASVRAVNLLQSLQYYLSMLKKHRDLLRRRIILKEEIPHSEKVFSIFEDHVEWNTKGKLHKGVELGHNTLIATDQYQFILYHEVFENQVDKTRTIGIGQGIADKYGGEGYHLSSISFDRNFFSFAAKKALGKLYDEVILPKPGKKNAEQLAEESAEIFVKKRKAHSAVESNINQLEHHGLSKCRDKGIDGFKRYVAYGVLAYNLHRMGRILMEMESQKIKSRAQAA